MPPKQMIYFGTVERENLESGGPEMTLKVSLSEVVSAVFETLNFSVLRSSEWLLSHLFRKSIGAPNILYFPHSQ